jgi:polysaccharide biosynthesis protein PslH
MGESGRAYVRRAHDWSVAASQLEQVYASLVPLKRKEPTCV